MTNGDHYRHLADLTEYVRTQAKVTELFATQEAWDTKAILNVAHSGKFSSDRTIAEYAPILERGAVPGAVTSLTPRRFRSASYLEWSASRSGLRAAACMRRQPSSCFSVSN